MVSSLNVNGNYHEQSIRGKLKLLMNSSTLKMKSESQNKNNRKKKAHILYFPLQCQV